MLLVSVLHAASKSHVVTLGKWQTVKWVFGASDGATLELKVPGILVDGNLKEYAVGQTHEVPRNGSWLAGHSASTTRLPVKIRRNNGVGNAGGWLLVDRASGRISTVTLPLMDSFYSVYSVDTWYRDYVAYCGVSEDGRKVFAVVTQLGRRKPLSENMSKLPIPLKCRTPPVPHPVGNANLRA